MESIKLGKWNMLVINRFTDHGAYLEGGELGEILMPKKYVLDDFRAGDEVEVFVYLDQGERLVATREEPLAEVGDFAFLEVSWVNEYGAFLDWGLMKDLFVPFREQKKKMVQGDSYVVYIYIDKKTKRIAATAKIDKYLSKDMPNYEIGDEVEILIWQKTELGFKVIIDNKYSGLIYENEIFIPLRTGYRMKAYIKQVREDGKIDISLQHSGKKRVEDFSEILLETLEAEGSIALTDKSSAEEIKLAFGVSKKTFKKGVGNLYKRKLIQIFEDRIDLIQNEK